jgi:ABC-type branched-subunit amino acid transport system substrate-binding protein
MKRSRWVTLAVALMVSVGTLAATAVTAVAQSSGAKPKATDVGITATEIHIAVIADVDNPIVPNLFLGSVDAVKGFAKYMNANGGLAGRKVVVDFYDSKLNPNTTTNAEISACENDVAAVGTSAVFLTSVDNMRNCKDSTGAVTGLPDIPFVSTALVQQCSDQSFPMAPPQVICSTKDQHPQTFQPNIGRAYYYNQKFGTGKTNGVYIFGSDSKSARDSSFVSGIGQLRVKCCTSDGDFDISGFANQSAYTPVVQKMKSSGSNYGQATTYQAMTLLRKEATLQGLTDVKVWDCTVGCYDTKFLQTAGSDSEGQYVDLLFLPFYSKAEQKANKGLANFVKYTGTDKVASFGAYAWAAGIAFRDAVNAAVKNNGGVNGVTRKTIFAELNKIHEFNADGMFGTIDLAGRKTSPCHVLLQVKNGDFKRVFPTKVGTFDCAAKNVVQVKLDVYGT